MTPRDARAVFLTFVVVNVQVVWRREDGDEGRESRGLTLPIHPVTSREGRAEDGGEEGELP